MTEKTPLARLHEALPVLRDLRWDELLSNLDSRYDDLPIDLRVTMAFSRALSNEVPRLESEALAVGTCAGRVAIYEELAPQLGLRERTFRRLLMRDRAPTLRDLARVLDHPTVGDDRGHEVGQRDGQPRRTNLARLQVGRCIRWSYAFSTVFAMLAARQRSKFGPTWA